MSSIQVDSITESTTNAGVTMSVPLTHKAYTTTQMNALTGMGAGDTIYNSTDGTLYVFNGVTWNAMSGNTFGFTVSYLVVAGGGGGASAWNSANRGGGGGGAGGYRSSFGSENTGGGLTTETPLAVAFGTTLSLSIGGGGNGGSGGYFQDGTKGTDTTLGAIQCYGGGASGDGANIHDGGSGAGAAYSEGAGSGTAGQGFDGGGRNTGSSYTGGSGGGAGGAGTYGPHRNNPAVAGGAGVTSSITGSAVERAKGGGSRTGGTGAANTGNGGEGREGTSAYAGGSGVIILRWTTADATIGATRTGLVDGGVQQAGSDSYIIFTGGSGNITFSSP